MGMIKLKDLLPESTAVSRYYDKNSDKLYGKQITIGPKYDFDTTGYVLKQLFPDERIDTRQFKMDDYTPIIDKYLKGYSKLISPLTPRERYNYNDDVMRHLDMILHRGGDSFFIENEKIPDATKFFVSAYTNGSLHRLSRSGEYMKFSLQSKGIDGKHYHDLLLNKIATRLGVTGYALESALIELDRIQSKSYQKLKPEAYEIMRKLTVGRRPLPRVLYRGMFFDGAKVKDAKKFEAQWAIGRSPNIGLGKPTSWSASKAVAKSFTMSQDNVKDSKNGYMILLRLDNPTKDEIIVDMNALGGGQFWNQVEYIVDPKCKRWVVDDIERGNDYDSRVMSPQNKAEKLAHSHQNNAGTRHGEILLNPFIIPSLQLPIDDKVEMMGLQDKTLRQAQASLVGSNHGLYPLPITKYMDCQMPLAGYMFCLGIGLVRFYMREIFGETESRFFDDSAQSHPTKWKINASKSNVSITVTSNTDGSVYKFDVKMTSQSFTAPRATITLGASAKKDVASFKRIMQSYEGGPVNGVTSVLDKLKSATSIR